MVLPQEVKVKLLFWYVENGRSVAKTQRKFKVHYQRKKAPDRNSILDIVKNMEENGSVGRRTYSERAKTARTPENIRKIKAKMTDSPHRSARRRYLAMLKRYYLPNIRRHGEQDTITFHQDGAPPHYANLVRDWLEETFQGRVISRGFEDFWPPYSPDLNPCDFYLWGYLKSKVYRDPVPTTLEELRKNIRREIRRINEDTQYTDQSLRQRPGENPKSAG